MDANRVGRVSSIDYEAGTYEVTYQDKGKSVTRKINAMSNGEYKMPSIGQMVSVSHQGNGTAAASTTGTIWNKTNKPAEGFKGLYRKEYADTNGQAYERYDSNTGEYIQCIDGKAARLSNGEIYDEAKNAFQMISKEGSISLRGKTGVGISTEKTTSIESAEGIDLETAGDFSREVTGKVYDEVQGGAEIVLQGVVTLNINGATVTIAADGSIIVTSPVKIEVTAPVVTITQTG